MLLIIVKHVDNQLINLLKRKWPLNNYTILYAGYLNAPKESFGRRTTTPPLRGKGSSLRGNGGEMLGVHPVAWFAKLPSRQ